MNKKIKVIELLNLLAENKIKKGTRINYNNVIYKVDFPNLAGVYKENGGTSIYDNLFTSLDIIELNKYVEILEDEEEMDIKMFEDEWLNEHKLSEEELKAIWNLTQQGVDLEELEKVVGEIQEILKPVFKLYTKNVQTYLKYKK